MKLRRITAPMRRHGITARSIAGPILARGIASIAKLATAKSDGRVHTSRFVRPWRVKTEEVRDGRADIEAVYRAQHERLWRALLSYSGDPDVESDAEAEAFAQVLRRGDAVDDPAAWVWTAAFKIAGGMLQTRRRDVALAVA